MGSAKACFRTSHRQLDNKIQSGKDKWALQTYVGKEQKSKFLLKSCNLFTVTFFFHPWPQI